MLAGLGKAYGDGTRAVTDLDLDIRDGEFLVLVGPSGCGKSTALRMVAGLETISEGTIRIGDRVVNDVPSRDRDVAMVFQSYALYPHLNVFDNIAFGLTLRRMPKKEIRQRVRRVAEVLELTEHLDRKPRNLSGGQRQRVAMGRAMVRSPQVFLMDEPLSNLDAKLRVQMRAQIARMQRDLGVTTVYVTHDQTEAMTLGDRVAVMKRGVLQQVGPPQELYDRPVNLFVAGFIGSPGMNLLVARLHVDGDGQHWVTLNSDALRLPDSVLHERPALANFVGRDVVLGVRPEDMEDATLVDHVEGSLLHSVADLVEAMGSDVLVHYPVDAQPADTVDTRALAEDSGADDVPAKHNGMVMVGRFSPRSRIYEGQPIAIWIDTARLHFFDPITGAAIWNEESS
ncbi:carbohydrate ABC transporter ATP-binding protein, CUT1 family [Actinokineospora alba]|uniref:Carbohydrate ABC transporter ATP-binding protein, CUT1 family n=2 Tax=Actinokineospora alba TaxID=504798 RepID=A0A1H0L4D8_9PSEU|nr:carbohydrate ABC transporter ATP-binding protein (CUT1 family) [Actinokineospora alba]SDJ04654.1 multiple sugar transport system ATP-binding protein [Actinokineospora alba]SDO63098.1 carbohydrate ABC transporter ATP-binding protein, CUT1 family [Actinokineospora alba]